MKTPVTKDVIRNHLQAFLEHKGLDAILSDYADDASFLSEGRIYRGKTEIREFFEAFMAALPPQAIQQFSLHTLCSEDDVAQITWSIGKELPPGTDTFVVLDGKIVSQTCAIYTPPKA